MAEPLHVSLKKNIKATDLRHGIEKTFESHPVMSKPEVVRIVTRAGAEVGKRYNANTVHTVFSRLEQAGIIQRTPEPGVYARKGASEAASEALRVAQDNFGGLASRFEPTTEELNELVMFVHNRMRSGGITGHGIVDRIIGRLGHRVREKYPGTLPAKQREIVNRAVNSRIARLRQKKAIVTVAGNYAVHAYPGVEISDALLRQPSRKEGREKPKKEKQPIQKKPPAEKPAREKKPDKPAEQTFRIPSMGELTAEQVVKRLSGKDPESEKMQLRNFMFLYGRISNYAGLFSHEKFVALRKKHGL